MDLLWLVPLLPFAGAALNAALGPRTPRPATTAVALGAPGLSLAVALWAIWQYAGARYPEPFVQTLYAWTTGPIAIDVGFLLDPLSAVMTFIVTFVGFLIHVYSVGYMAHEPGYQRYFVYLNLFMGAMLLLVLGSNYLVSFVGWEGVGLCSYLLIGYYYDQEFPPFAGKKAFIVNRIGDFAFLVGLLVLFGAFGTLDYLELFGALEADPGLGTQAVLWGLPLATLVGACLFIGAMGKSAQIPLYVWLPDAMAGPTPVSALIHAATMVTAGVFMVARSNAIYQLAPGVSLAIAGIGAATAIFAATIGLAQTDIKKVLAYSTVSQLGYMFLAAGLGAYTAAIFHVATHAFFKALLFLGSGSVIHAMGGEQDMRRMGGLKKHLPVTYWTFLVGTLAISGIPPLAGFFSKDEILAAAAGHGQWLLYAVGLATAGLTACYMFRAVFLTFHGKFRGTDEERHHLHESPPVMTVPLVVLAIGAAVVGFLGIPAVFPHLFGVEADWNWIDRFLEPSYSDVVAAEPHHLGLGAEIGFMLLAVLVAAAGIGLAWRFYGGDRGLDEGRRTAARFPGVHRVLVNKYYVDELYDAALVRPLRGLSRFFWRVVDGRVIDGTIHLGAYLTELTGDLGRLTTTGNVRNYALYFFLGLVVLLTWVLL
ncbi:MAG TPA: NADH-quinone oxidoreductase subunit L [Thermoanaerobaculia bacterium]|nr:NADH-quinone oxidoreductase subunit L [Thermoanaerobaculia bacterium]